MTIIEGDRRRRTPAPTPNALISSAEILTRRREDAPKNEPWQNTAWAYYDEVGELRYAARWNGNALSRCRLMAARRPEKPGDEPIPAEPGTLAFDLVESLAGGIGRQSQMLRSFGTHLMVPGRGYLVGRTGLDGNEWGVYSADEISTQGETWLLKKGDELSDLEPLEDDHLVVKVWTPHERFHWRPDSPTRGALVPLREVSDMNEHVHASAQSRLAGAGLLLLPTEVQFPTDPRWADSPDPLTAMFMEVMETAIANRGSAAARVPIILRIPGEWIEHVQHLTFDVGLDGKAIEMRDAAIRRVAASMDLPAEVVLGLGDVNHWSAWQIEESALKLHIEPELEAICAGVTTGFLWPSMRALAEMGGTPGVPEDITDWIVWYDTSELTTRPDKGDSAVLLFDRLQIGGTALRRELGFNDDDKPTSDELRAAVLLKVLADAPALAGIVLPALGITVDLPAAPIGEVAPQAPQGPQEADQPTVAPIPPTKDVGPQEGAEQDAPMAAAAAVEDARREAALLAACDGVVHRALERAGNTLRSLSKKRPEIVVADAGNCPPEAFHTCLGVDCSTVTNLDHLLTGAWDRLPAIASRYDTEGDPLVAAVDAYTRALLAAGQEHTYDRLAMFLGGASTLTPVPA